MLTTEQCIRVATELWGWRYKPYRSIEMWFDNGIGRFWHKEEIQKEVNSWQGFGRTVEAMSLPVYGVFRINATDMYADYLRGLHSKEILWEQTHLQALEARKND